MALTARPVLAITVRRTWAVVLAALLLLLGGGVPATACQHGTDRPFKASASGQFAFDASNPRDCLAGFTGVVQAAGHATHLGALRVSSTHCEGDGVSYDGHMTLTAANGDTLKGTYLTHWVITGATVHVTGDLTINGGTGRFRGATGTLAQDHTISLTSDEGPWPLAMTFAGTIRY